MCQGFSTNPQNPGDMSSPVKAPLFEFNASRLKKDSNGFLVYMDTYTHAPYAYFSAGRTPNAYSSSDCSNISAMSTTVGGSGYPMPYLASAGNYWRPNSWQIISAGDSGKFAPGGTVWGIGNAIKKPTVGWNNQANFATNILNNPP
jgi:hypothetical protein